MKHVTFKNLTLSRQKNNMASQAMDSLSLENPQDWLTRMEAAHQVLTASSGHDIPQDVRHRRNGPARLHTPSGFACATAGVR